MLKIQSSYLNQISARSIFQRKLKINHQQQQKQEVLMENCDVVSYMFRHFLLVHSTSTWNFLFFLVWDYFLRHSYIYIYIYMFVSTVGSVDSVLFFYSVLIVIVFTSSRNKLDNLDISLFLIVTSRRDKNYRKQ